MFWEACQFWRLHFRGRRLTEETKGADAIPAEGKAQAKTQR